jgi:hypothetical protein
MNRMPDSAEGRTAGKSNPDRIVLYICGGRRKHMIYAQHIRFAAPPADDGPYSGITTEAVWKR